MASKLQRENFIRMIAPLTVKVCKERGYGNAQAWTCIAQACCESNYGQSRLMANANAFFGIKANATWVRNATYGGLVYSTKTREVYSGQSVVITDKFRAYRSMEDSVRDYFDLIAGPRYKKSLNANSVMECISYIKNGGYATAPNYVSTIMNFYNTDRVLIETFTVSQATVTPNKAEAPARPILKIGSKGSEVIYLHRRLRMKGYGVDGNNDTYNKLTEQCVMHLQAVNALTIDGVVGPKTWKVVDE